MILSVRNDAGPRAADASLLKRDGIFLERFCEDGRITTEELRVYRDDAGSHPFRVRQSADLLGAMECTVPPPAEAAGVRSFSFEVQRIDLDLAVMDAPDCHQQ